jgi:predicted DNA-binding transcriptional regulator AlpA
MANSNPPFGFKPIRRNKRRPPAQVAAAKEAAAIKAANADRAKADALASMPGLTVTDDEDPATVPAYREHGHRAQAPRAPPRGHGIRLLDKREILAITNVTFPTIWTWMRNGTFPRSRVVGGKSMWLSTDVEAWLAALPIRTLKGDAPEALDNENPASVGSVGRFCRGSAS